MLAELGMEHLRLPVAETRKDVLEAKLKASNVFGLDFIQQLQKYQMLNIK